MKLKGCKYASAQVGTAGAEKAARPETFFVEAREGPLFMGELERAIFYLKVRDWVFLHIPQ